MKVTTTVNQICSRPSRIAANEWADRVLGQPATNGREVQIADQHDEFPVLRRDGTPIKAIGPVADIGADVTKIIDAGLETQSKAARAGI